MEEDEVKVDIACVVCETIRGYVFKRPPARMSMVHRGLKEEASSRSCWADHRVLALVVLASLKPTCPKPKQLAVKTFGLLPALSQWVIFNC